MAWTGDNVAIDTNFLQDVVITGSLTVDTKIKLDEDTLTTATNIPLIIKTDSLVLKPYGNSTPNNNSLEVQKHDGTTVFSVNPKTSSINVNGTFNSGSIGVAALDLDNIDIDGNIIKIDSAGRDDVGVDNRVQIEQLLVKIGSNQPDLFTVEKPDGTDILNIDSTTTPPKMALTGDITISGNFKDHITIDNGKWIKSGTYANTYLRFEGANLKSRIGDGAAYFGWLGSSGAEVMRLNNSGQLSKGDNNTYLKFGDDAAGSEHMVFRLNAISGNVTYNTGTSDTITGSLFRFHDQDDDVQAWIDSQGSLSLFALNGTSRGAGLRIGLDPYSHNKQYNAVRVGIFNIGSMSQKNWGTDGNLYFCSRNVNTSNGSYVFFGQRDSHNTRDKGSIQFRTGEEGVNSQSGDFNVKYGGSTSNTRSTFHLDGATGFASIFGGDSWPNIDTITPEAVLHIKSAANPLMLGRDGYDTKYKFTVATDQLTIRDANTSAYIFHADSSSVEPKIGIGTTSPNTTLHLKSDTTSSVAITMKGNTAKTGVISADNVKFLMRGDTGTPLYFDTNGSNTRMVIDVDGKVGIGTTSPSSKMHLVDATAGTDDSIVTAMKIDANQTLTSSDGDPNTIGVKYGLEIAQSGTANVNNPTRVVGLHIPTYSGTTYQGNISAQFADGLVLGGDASSAYRKEYGLLQLKGISDKHASYNTSENTIFIGDVGKSGHSTTDNFGGINYGTSVANIFGGIYFHDLGVTGKADIVFKGRTTSSSTSNNTELMRLKNTGNLGIGTDSPDTHFHIVGASARARIQCTGNTGADWLATSTAADPHSVAFGIDNGTYEGRILVEHNSGLSLHGESDMDAASPTGKFANFKPNKIKLLGSAATNNIQWYNTSSTSTADDKGFTMSLNSADFNFNNREAGNIQFATSDTTRMLIHSGGGLRTQAGDGIIIGDVSSDASANYGLHVAGSETNARRGIYMVGYANGGSTSLSLTPGGSNPEIKTTGSSNHLRIDVHNTHGVEFKKGSDQHGYACFKANSGSEGYGLVVGGTGYAAYPSNYPPRYGVGMQGNIGLGTTVANSRLTIAQPESNTYSPVTISDSFYDYHIGEGTTGSTKITTVGTTDVTTWVADANYTNQAPTGNTGPGNGAKFDIAVNGSGTPTFTVTSYSGSGYRTTETLTFTEPATGVEASVVITGVGSNSNRFHLHKSSSHLYLDNISGAGHKSIIFRDKRTANVAVTTELMKLSSSSGLVRAQIGDIGNSSPDAILRVQSNISSVNSPFSADNDNDNPYVNNYNLSLYNHGSSGSSANQFEQYSTLAFNPNNYGTDNTHTRLTGLIAARTISRAQGTGELMFGVCSSTGPSGPTHKVTISNSGIALYNKKLPNTDGNVATLSDDGARGSSISFYGINRGSSDHTTMSAYQNDVIDDTNGSNSAQYRQGYLKMSHSGTSRDRYGKFEGFLNTGNAWNSNDASSTKRFIYVPTSITGDAVRSTFLGVSSGEGNAHYSTGLGYGTLQAGGGSNNVAIGYNALNDFVHGTRNVAIGSNCMDLAGTSSSTNDNIAIGYETMKNLDGGERNVAIGNYAGANLTIENNNTLLGNKAGQKLGTGGTGSTEITALGFQALLNAGANGTDGNTAVGYNTMAGGSNASSDPGNGVWMGANEPKYSTAIGAHALGSGNLSVKQTSQYCLAAGYAAQNYQTTGSFNTTVSSYNTGRRHKILSAQYTTNLGFQAGANHTTGHYNTYLGAFSGPASYPNYDAENWSTGAYNTAVGGLALGSLKNAGTSNTAVGYNAGNNVSISSFGTFIGYEAKCNYTLDNVSDGQVNIGAYGGFRSYSNKITLSDFTGMADNDNAFRRPIIKLPRYGFLKRITCTVVEANGGGTGKYNISLGTNGTEGIGATVTGRIELIGASIHTDANNGATLRQSTVTADGDTAIDIDTAKYVHIWESSQSSDSSGWTLLEGQAMYVYICHAANDNASNAQNTELRITVEYFGEH